MTSMMATANNGLDGTTVARDIIEALLKGLLLAWPIWAAIAAIVFLRIAYAIFRRWRLARSGIYEIDRLSGKVFEEYLELLFRRLGYSVERTRFVGDYGGDLVLRKDGVHTVVQAKRYSKPVGVRAIQEVVAAKRAYDCTEAMVVTNNRFTRQAAHLAETNDVELWDRDALVRQLTAAGGRGRLHSQGESTAMPETVPSSSAPTVEEGQPLATVEACRQCGRVLSSGERRYCEQNAKRFGGQMLCFRHQRTARA